MGRVATQQDLAEAFQLRSSPGWQTLRAILQSTGERIPKRPREAGADVDIVTSAASTPVAPAAAAASLPRPVVDPEGPLAKRIAAVRLNDDRPSPPPRPK